MYTLCALSNRKNDRQAYIRYSKRKKAVTITKQKLQICVQKNGKKVKCIPLIYVFFSKLGNES